MADDVVFQEAVEALRTGEKKRARDMLTGLIKNDQNNANYWIWLSAAMETPKERIYCLQTAFKLDPENAAAKRGLILLGAMPADETIQPFSLKRARTWEEKLLLAHEKPKPRGWAAVKASPIFRLGFVILLVGAIASGIGFGFVIPAIHQRNARPPTHTPGPSPTYTLTVTAVGAKPRTPVPGTPGGLAEVFNVQYTATPLYVPVERSPITSDFLLQFDSAYKAGQWQQAIEALLKIIEAEPEAVFAYYYLGEAYRFNGQPGFALQYYNTAVERNPSFGPGYVGLARAQLQSNPNANVLPLLDDAIRYDPNFGEAYLERARVKTRDGDIQGAIADLGEANQRMAESPLVFHYLAQTRLKEGELELALNAAKRSNELDVTFLPNYLLLGQIHEASGQYEEAVKILNTYLKYAPNDLSTHVMLGKIQFDLGSYEAVIQTMEDVIRKDPGRREPYLYRFLAYVELGNGQAADADVERALSYYPDLFEANLGLVRTHLLNGRNGTALVDLDKTLSLAETDEQKAQAFYWAAIVHEERDEAGEAAAYWQQVLDLPQESMTAAMRKVAQEHLLDIWTPTPTLELTQTQPATPTKPVIPTQTPTRTPVRTPIP